jgi:hypothetical protein
MQNGPQKFIVDPSATSTTIRLFASVSNHADRPRHVLALDVVEPRPAKRNLATVVLGERGALRADTIRLDTPAVWMDHEQLKQRLDFRVRWRFHAGVALDITPGGDVGFAGFRVDVEVREGRRGSRKGDLLGLGRGVHGLVERHVGLARNILAETGGEQKETPGDEDDGELGKMHSGCC